MKRLSSCFVSVLALMFLYSCTDRPDDIRTLKVDIPESGIAVLNLDEYDRIELSEEVLVDYISTACTFRDGYIIRPRKNLMYFTGEGKYVSNIGREGRGPGEYTSLDMIYTLGDTVCLYSYLDGRTLNKYVYSDSAFTYIYRQNIEPASSQLVFETPEFPGKFFVQNAFKYGAESGTPLFAVYDRDMNELCSSSALSPVGGYTGQFFSVCDNTVYHSYFGRDTILAYNGSEIVPAFRYDFGRAGIEGDPGKKTSTIYSNPDRLYLMNQLSLVTERYIYAVIIRSGGYPLIMCYDRSSEKAALYMPVFGDGEEAYVSTIFTDDAGNLVVAVNPNSSSVNLNPVLYKIIFN